jgi:hypothetical protein
VSRFFSRCTENDEEFVKELRVLLRIAFPRTVSMAWRGDPVDEILKLDRIGLQKAITDFFESQGVKMKRAVFSPT